MGSVSDGLDNHRTEKQPRALHLATLEVVGSRFDKHETRQRALKLRCVNRCGGNSAGGRKARRVSSTFEELAERHLAEVAEPSREPTIARSHASIIDNGKHGGRSVSQIEFLRLLGEMVKSILALLVLPRLVGKEIGYKDSSMRTDPMMRDYSFVE